MNQRKLEKSKQIFFIYLGIDILFNAILGFHTFSTIEILEEIQSGTRNFNQLLIDNLNLWGNLSFIIIIILIGVGISLVSWLNSCYSFAKNSLIVTGFKNESWTITGWIVPVYNFLKPYQILNEIHKAGSPDYVGATDWKKEKASGWLLAWWFFWVVTHLVMGIIIKELFQQYFHDKFVLEEVIFYEIQMWYYVISTLITISWFFVAQSLTERLIRRSIKIVDNGNNNREILYKTAYKERSYGQILENIGVDQEEKISLYQSYLDESINDGTRFDGALDKNWSIALKYYKDLSELESRLSRISRQLSYKFRTYMLEKKVFDDREKIVDAMEYDFLISCFGENQKLVDFARYLIRVGNKPAAKSLSEAVRVVGNKINSEEIIDQIKNEFSDSFRKRLEIITVNEKSEAERLGIQEGDILYSYNEIPVESNDVLASLMNQYQGQQHILKIIRGQQQLEFYVTAGSLGISAKPTSDKF
jgi:hypothetical protein